jgi:hypothetical protein
VALVGAAAWVLVRSGDVELLLVVGAFVAVVVALSNRGALLAVRTDGVADRSVHADVRALSRRGVIAAVLCGAGATVVIAAVGLGVTALFGLVVSGIGWLVVGRALRTEGEFTAETLRYAGREVSLAAVERVRRLRAGPWVWLWLSYHRGTAGTMAPRLVPMPATAYAAAEAALERATARDPETTGRRASTAVRVVAGLFGVGFLAAGSALWLILPPGDGRAVALYGAAVCGLFAVVFGWYALVA